jgi:hypothetical protein
MADMADMAAKLKSHVFHRCLGCRRRATKKMKSNPQRVTRVTRVTPPAHKKKSIRRKASFYSSQSYFKYIVPKNEAPARLWYDAGYDN